MKNFKVFSNLTKLKIFLKDYQNCKGDLKGNFRTRTNYPKDQIKVNLKI